jgi:hypothetical protein
VLLRYAEDALDEAGVPDCDLDVGLLAKTRRWVDRKKSTLTPSSAQGAYHDDKLDLTWIITTSDFY